MGQIQRCVLVLGCVCLVRGCGSKVRLRRGGDNLSLCHRCISLEYLWFYTRVTQLCVFAFTLKQRGNSCLEFQKEECDDSDQTDFLEHVGKCRTDFCAEVLQ